MRTLAAIIAACCLLQLGSTAWAASASATSAEELLEAAKEELGFMVGVRRQASCLRARCAVLALTRRLHIACMMRVDALTCTW